ncbi:DUF397 domain-containing protein [Streptomyces sp. CA-294286]|uniref:DUF397 domain-containing protein n=1 Tax=Streptomyces sp. CA-294286 TaxID=3240070 RepID=UPI003D9223F8
MTARRIVTAFKKASASQGGSQECVEVARTADGGRAVRDTKDRDRGAQFHHPAAWGDFLAAVKTDTFR